MKVLIIAMVMIMMIVMMVKITPKLVPATKTARILSVLIFSRKIQVANALNERYTAGKSFEIIPLMV